MIKFYSSALIMLLVVSCSFAFAQENKADQLEEFFVVANQRGLFNGNVLIAEKGNIVYKKAIGFADASGKELLTEQHRFHIGSIAKEFNAVGIMLLVQDGKLDLEDKVSSFMPELPAWADKVSIKNLLQYTSGLPDINWEITNSDAQHMEELKKVKELKFEPGTSYDYNNNNVFLQRRIIERVSGVSFKEFTEEQMLKPLGMKNAVIDPTDEEDFIAKSFDNHKKQDALEYPISGWTCLNLEDFYTWSKSIHSFQLLTPASTRAILIPFAENKQAGLGKGLMEGDKILRHVHDGSTLNYKALLVSDASGRTVILMTNNENASLYEMNTAIQAILDSEPYRFPKKPVFIDHEKELGNLTGSQILDLYTSIKKADPDLYDFENEYRLNEVGYDLLEMNKVADAVIIFEYNTKLFPESSNVYDSLGEAYYIQGDKKNALLNYKKSLQLDPANKHAKKIIAELES